MGELAFTAGGLAQDILAGVARNHSLGVTENDTGVVAAAAFDVHEV
jgi:hypothetical protein